MPGNNPSGKNSKDNHIQAAIFDLDGVLMDTEVLAFEAWKEVAASYGGKLSKKFFLQMIGLTAEESGELVMQATRVQFDLDATVAQVWQKVIDRIQSGIRPLPGAGELVLNLHERGLPLAVASNSPTYYIEISLLGLGMAGFFKEMVGVDQVERGKPDPDIYLRAAELLGVQPGRCLAVEDSYVGSQAALRAGMRVVAVPSNKDRREKFRACYRVYDSLADAGMELDGILHSPL